MESELYKASHNISYTWQPDILLARWMRTGPVTIVLFDWSETLPPHSQDQCSLEQGLFKHDPVKARGRLVVELESVPTFVGRESGKPFWKTTLSTPSQDLNPDLPVIANTRVTPKTMRPCVLFTIKNRVHGTSDPRHRGLQTLAIDVEVELHMVEVAFVSHSLLINSDRMKPRSGDWVVRIYFLQEAAITAPSSSSCVRPTPVVPRTNMSPSWGSGDILASSLLLCLMMASEQRTQDSSSLPPGARFMSDIRVASPTPHTPGNDMLP
uniref:Uncharacterized protein n=1 Tax=Timema genevievae TaxID=629358 RepID=A0A7R9JTT5_TIMGE|nr:unnamed protein product [Timema genevievae]